MNLPSVTAVKQKWGSLSSLARKGAYVVERRLAETRIKSCFSPSPTDEFVAGVYFGSDRASEYQLEQWLWPFEQLANRLTEVGEGAHPLGIFVRDAQVAQHIATLTDLPVRSSRMTAGLAEFFSNPALKLTFYVNQATNNFQALRFPGPAHVHLSHGESEKISMISNQLKAYDYVFTAGQAARDRITSTLWGIDPSALIDVGRPQLDREWMLPEAWKEFDRQTAGPVAFYAPTWEGDSPSMAYGALPETGLELVRELFALGYRVIFRAHPRTGIFRREFSSALKAVRSAVEGHPNGFIDDTNEISWQFDIADIAAIEMSSVAFDWLSTHKPLILISPSSPGAEILPDGLFDKVTAWGGHGPAPMKSVIDQASSIDMAKISRRYLGDTEHGAQIARFIAGSSYVINARR
ncbi:MAG: CDP-glycerol glycerophosphotransferase family protein [Brevibacterium sp.]